MGEATIFLNLLCFCYVLYVCKGCLNEERTALIQLWESSINQPFGSVLHANWQGNDNCCEWPFLQCDSFNSIDHVVLIDLSGHFKGAEKYWYPNASLFTQFKELQTLRLDDNNIRGWIMPKALCELRNLKELSLEKNNLDDKGLPTCLANGLPFLREIYLQGNSFSLSFPLLSALCGLRNLRVLDLSNNILSNGSLPPCMLDTFSYLEMLYLSNFPLEESSNVLTALQGAINLRGLVLKHNNLNHGSMRALCGVIRNLKTLVLSFSHFNVESIPPCLQQSQSSLENLYLDGIFTKHSTTLLEGLICGQKKKLKILKLDNNGLSDEDLPSCLFDDNFVLEEFYFSSNNLRGSLGFSTGLCKLRRLRELGLSMNSINNIPWPCLIQLKSLQSLNLSQNQISGIVPPSISNLTSLVSFDISRNKLEGMVFFSMFANLSNLEEINLSNNLDLEVETAFPTYWIPDFQLHSLGLENCKLKTVPFFISTQYNLNELSLSGNSLQGTIPPWLFYNATPRYQLKLSSNHLHGSFPLSILWQNETSRLKHLDISDNNIMGNLPDNFDTVFPDLVLLNVSKNKLEGFIPSSFGKLMDLQFLDSSNNFFEGEIPLGLTRNNTSLKLLALSNNYLEAMASSVSNMTNLQFLSLDGNCFTRLPPITASTIPSLILFDISRNSISGYMQHWYSCFPNLIALLVRGNYFVGSLPSRVCQMRQLRFLDVSSNSLSGTIPSCLNNISSWLEKSESPLFTEIWSSIYIDVKLKINFATKRNLYLYEGLPLAQMAGIDLSLNHFSGNIPSQIGDLRALLSLNLSHNSFIGHIPVSFQELKNLESLDLSHNKLTGNIPPQIIQLYSLSTFDVSFNQLSGKIPYENNFATFTIESYLNNPGLCGPPTDVKCSSPQSPHNEYNHHEADDEEQNLLDNDLMFYSCVVISYLLGFWAIVAPLLFCRNWRKKYYRIIDGCICIDWCSYRFF